jgi:hypothetical protein
MALLRRLKDVTESAESVTREHPGSSQGRDASPSYDEEEQLGWPMAAEVATSEQTSQSEHRLIQEFLNQRQKPGDREVMAEGAGRECAITTDAIILDDGSSDKRPVCGVQEERAARNEEAEEGAGSPCGPSKEAVEDKGRSFEPLSGRSPGSKGASALVLQDVRWLTKQKTL